MRPYFSVGEEVIFVSQNFPERNGEYVVRSIGKVEQFVIISTSERFMDLGYDIGIHINGYSAAAQRSLRKKHKPADQSFSELIKSTKEIKV